MLTGGDPIRAEDKNVKAFTYHNVAKLTRITNDLLLEVLILFIRPLEYVRKLYD